MYLKRIELEGFKSFADRTVIPVERGLTGIVGPNGCGKSNVVDALLWVMGERSAKALRADAMDDVIFKGAEGRAAAPYAMVEVILGDPEGKIVEAGGELAVGRRLFAGGEAEYLLHGRKVRRKDVREVLLDTGLGVQGYMVLAQGKIDAVLAANPEERRSVFEEAAGISRYKARKHEAKLKLKRVDQDLARVEDVLEEVSRAVRSLRLQAGKAKRFVEMRDRHRELRVRFSLADHATWSQQDKELRVQEGELEKQVESLRTERDQVQLKLAELEKEESVLRTRHDALRSEAGEIKEKAAGLEERVHGLETRASEGETRIQRDRLRLTSLASEKQEDADAASGLLEQQTRLSDGLAKTEIILKEAEAAFAEAREARRSQRDRMEGLRRTVLDALQERTRWNNEIAHAAKRRSEAEGGQSALKRRRVEIAAESDSSHKEFEELGLSLSGLVTGAETAQETSSKIAQEVSRLKDERSGYGKVAHEARQRRASASARLEAFQAIDEEMPGVPDYLRKFLAAKHEGVGGWILEDVHIEQPWDRLLENLLGRLQHAIWLHDSGAAQDLADGMYDFFFPMKGDMEPAPAITGTRALRSLLSGNAAACDSLCARLGAVYCAEPDVDVRSLAQQHPQALFLSASGAIQGRGYLRCGVLAEDSTGRLARRNERDLAAKTLQESQIEFDRAFTLEEAAAESLSSADIAAGEAEIVLRKAVADREDCRARFDAVERRAKALKEELSAMDQEAKQLAEVVQSTTKVESDAAKRRDVIEETRLRSNQELEQLQGVADEKDVSFESASQAQQEARVEHSGLETEFKHWRTRHAELLTRSEKQTREHGSLETEITDLDKGCVALREEAERARIERTSLLERRVEIAGRVDDAFAQLHRASEVLHGARARNADESGHMERLLEKRQGLALEVQKIQMQLDELIRGVVEEFGQPLEDLARSLEIDIESPLPEDADAYAWRQELHQLKKKIESLGSVNLDAVQELEDRQERETFLIRERDDLVAGKTNLLDTLEELDIKCRERFVETFQKVQGEFEHIFRRLFRGGKASIQLEADVDPLEAGIEINVRPPGKDLRSINLLSGGERTLTALALLLAVFQSRPSPFCLLDEVDAALDDANVERFVDVLSDFTGTTQFLVVTHNRITMSRCERLFGVTMRKRGVSMVVSVELDQVAGEGELDLSNAEAVDPARARLAQGASADRVVVEKEMEAG
ncbi:MAG: chromosome segregation protein SMC [Planctomycetota bacterium]|nr:MAG: chromosome segregation protein SMC [Planctomycetota bacterium]